MSDLLGIIAPLKKFLSNTCETISVPLNFSLNAGRIYFIPDFQREIRWENDNIALLIDDIESGPKYLGNVILTQHPDNRYSIIDGQQRITVLTMILSCIMKLHSQHIDIISPCKLQIESFSKFSDLLKNYFPLERLDDPEVIVSDRLHQVKKYYSLWNFISSHPSIVDRRNAQKIIENLGKSSVNIILNKSDDIGDGIRYFIDVNLKGKQLDTEDIFKSYLFKNDQSKGIREAWYRLKTLVTTSDERKMNYPLLKYLEHYFYCDLYTDPKYKGMEFGSDFLLKREFRTRDSSSQVFREGMHLIELIGSKQYMLSSLNQLNAAIEIMLKIVNSASLTHEFEVLFNCVKPDGTPDRIDSTELQVIHNIMGKILKDEKNLPKALIMKYIITVFLDKTPKEKVEYQKIYGVYLLSVLFTIFENRKSKELLLNILKADELTWYTESILQINSYFLPDKITDTRLLAQYKLTANEEEEDYRFRCKSLATVYNFFTIQNDVVKIRKGKLPQLKEFITTDISFSIEHFIISQSSTRSTKVVLSNAEIEYKYDEKFYSKHVNNLFNFIFIAKDMNSSLSNYWIPQKLKLIDLDKVQCAYSLMVLESVKTLSASIEDAVKGKDTVQDNLDLFYARDYKDAYVEFARSILKAVIQRIKAP